MGELVDNIEHSVLPPVIGPVLDEVIRSDVVGILRPQADARPVREPQPPALGLFRGDLQPLASPNPLDPLIVIDPACLAQQFGDLAITVAAILPGKLDDVGAQPFLILGASWDLALRLAMLPQRRTGAALRHLKLPSDMLDTQPATRGAQKFPRAAP
jgi:hypothetical protein